MQQVRPKELYYIRGGYRLGQAARIRKAGITHRAISHTLSRPFATMIYTHVFCRDGKGVRLLSMRFQLDPECVICTNHIYHNFGG